MCVALRDVWSSLVVHLAAVAATRVRIPASCQILYIKYLKKNRDGVLDPGNNLFFTKYDKAFFVTVPQNVKFILVKNQINIFV